MLYLNLPLFLSTILIQWVRHVRTRWECDVSFMQLPSSVWDTVLDVSPAA